MWFIKAIATSFVLPNLHSFFEWLQSKVTVRRSWNRTFWQTDLQPFHEIASVRLGRK